MKSPPIFLLVRVRDTRLLEATDRFMLCPFAWSAHSTQGTFLSPRENRSEFSEDS